MMHVQTLAGFGVMNLTMKEEQGPGEMVNGYHICC
jgi:hypothetical protein